MQSASGVPPEASVTDENARSHCEPGYRNILSPDELVKVSGSVLQLLFGVQGRQRAAVRHVPGLRRRAV